MIDGFHAKTPGRDNNKVVNHRSLMRKSAIDSALSATSNPLKSIIDSSKLADELDIVFDDDTSHDEHLLLQERMRNPVAFAAEMIGDTMYYHQAMAQPDADNFRKAIMREIQGHIEKDTWEIVSRNEVPHGDEVLDSVWAMRRKRNLTTNEITKYKARLNVHGGMQTYGLNYLETYAPVVTWFSTRLLIITALLQNWSIRQVDFVMAYTQAPIENDMYMALPAGISTSFGNKKDYVLKLKKNLFGQKQAGRVWNQFLVQKLQDIGFVPSKVDECVFYRGTTIFIVYVDDGLVLDTSGKNLDGFVQELRNADLDVDDQGDPSDYVGVNINKDPMGYLNFTQQALIDSIIEDVGLTKSKRIRTTPGKSSQQLHAFANSQPFEEFHSFKGF